MPRPFREDYELWLKGAGVQNWAYVLIDRSKMTNERDACQPTSRMYLWLMTNCSPVQGTMIGEGGWFYDLEACIKSDHACFFFKDPKVAMMFKLTFA